MSIDCNVTILNFGKRHNWSITIIPVTVCTKGVTIEQEKPIKHIMYSAFGGFFIFCEEGERNKIINNIDFKRGHWLIHSKGNTIV